MTELGGLHPALCHHIVNTLGWTSLHPTQAEAIAPVLAGRNLLLLAPTAGGKTEAAAFPVLSRAATEGWQGVSVLYLCPLKALLNNLEPRLSRYASFVGFRAGLWHGDVGDAARRRMLRDPPEVLLTTPESLEAILISTRVDHRVLLGRVRVVIVDELHAFAGDDRGWHLRFLLSRLERLGGSLIQRIGLSATVGNPGELLEWLAPDRDGQVVGPSSPTWDGDVLVDYVGSVENAITVLSRLHRGERRLVFADSRSRVEEVASGLQTAGVRTFVSHASLSVDERRRAEAAFSSEPDCAIVATSTLELGLDVGDLDRVAQVGAPPSVSSFLQRMGRTGRRPGAVRNFLFLTTDDDEFLASLAIATLWREGFVDSVLPPALPAHIYAQQVMALVLQESGTTRPDLDDWLGDADNSVSEGVRHSVLAHMLLTGVLTEDAGVIGFGERGEREFGRRHFGDLVAAFSSPLMLRVQHGSCDLGTVHPASLTRRPGAAAPVLLLGGRNWKVTHVDWRRRCLAVVAVAGGGRSRWLGAGRMMPPSICSVVERIIAGTPPNCRLSQRANGRLVSIRDELAFVDASSLPVVAGPEQQVTVWLFAGGIASASIARAFRVAGIRVTRWDDFSVTLADTDVRHASRILSSPGTAQSHPDLPEDLAMALKFGLCLPTTLAEAVLTARSSAHDVVKDRLQRRHRLVYGLA